MIQLKLIENYKDVPNTNANHDYIYDEKKICDLNNKKIVNYIQKINDIIGISIDSTILLKIIFEMNRYFDKNFTECIRIYQKQFGRVFNQRERNLLRIYYYYETSQVLAKVGINNFTTIQYSENDVIVILEDCLQRCETYRKENIVASIIERKNNYEQGRVIDNSKEWLTYYDEKRKMLFDYSLLILSIDQQDFEKKQYDVNAYCSLIASLYDRLENYRHLIIKINGILRDNEGRDVTWSTIYKLGIFCENFVQYTDKFFPFKQEKAIHTLTDFLKQRFPDKDNETLARDFYSAISTGFIFEDCYISEQQEHIILSFKKIMLDRSPVPCPSCMTTIQGGNSFPQMFLRSYECKNPRCPERSKSGRGKRFDEFGSYRFFKLVENLEENRIDFDLYNSWHRDIFSSTNDINEMLQMYYAWGNEKICVYGEVIKSIQNRIIVDCVEQNIRQNNTYIKSYEELPIYKLFIGIKKNIIPKSGTKLLTNYVEIYNSNSSESLNLLTAGQIGSAITSPPYYNAREYSQWSNLIMYLVDMMINASSVYNTLEQDSYYLYNIGDIVDSDNVYVESNMSKRRLELGFLSCMFFEMVGFKLEGNIIWDKGEVQSKRNSTVNLVSGYVKCVNCYEHVFVLKKGEILSNCCVSYNKHFSPVIKINVKGENTYEHTAPYPPEMLDLLKPYIKPDKYVLDPFLGSGTTAKWCAERQFKVLGYELNKEYFDLCKKRIEMSTLNLKN